MESVESVITLFDITDQERVRYATYLFKSGARIWWNLVRETVNVSEMTWTEFRCRFEAEYRGVDVTCIRAHEFISLVQGTDSVKEYSTKFNQLSQYAPEIASTEMGRMQKFVYGLDPEIARDVMTGVQPPRTYAEALDRALRAEVFVRRRFGQTTG